jgi:succinoglycan biosynthesis transport protein ExoP
MDKEATAPSAMGTDLSEFASRYRRHIPLLLASTIAGGALMAGATFMMSSRYTAVAEMTYAPQVAPDVRGNQSASNQQLSDVARSAEVEAAVAEISSLQVSTRVIDALHLERDLGLRERAQKFNSLGDIKGALSMALLEGLKVRRVGETSLIDISYASKDPLAAAKLANAFGQAYVDQQNADNQAKSNLSTGRMGSSAAQLAQQARDADAAVARFKMQHQMVYEPNSPNIGQDIANVSVALADARAQLAEAQTRQRFVQAGGMNDAITTNSALSPLRDQQAQVTRNLASLESRYGPRHPKVVDAQRELDAIRGQVSQEVARQASVANAQMRFAEQKARSLESSLGATRQAQLAQVAAASELAGLQRQAETANMLYNNMLASQGQESAKLAVSPPDTTLTTMATPPLQPSSPILPLNVAVGLILGLAVGLGIAFVRERWSVGLKSNDDIDRVLGQNFFNSLPTLSSSVENAKTADPVEAITAHPLSLYTEAYRSLATSLRLSGPDVKVIGVTSALPKEGKTTCAVNMARTLAMAGERVILVDCDLRRRNVTTLMTQGIKKGMVQVVRGEASLNDVIHVDPVTGLHVLPLAPQSHVGSQPFGSPAFDAMMATLREQYDVVVVDTAPILAVVDTRLLLSHIDALGLLARWRDTPIRAIRSAIHQIESSGGEVAGVAMSLVDVNSQAHAGYGDASYYYAEMKGYYEAA